jgi:hypothetical protein
MYNTFTKVCCGQSRRQDQVSEVESDSDIRISKNFGAKEGVSCAVFKRLNKPIASHVTKMHAIIRSVFDFRIFI